MKSDFWYYSMQKMGMAVHMQSIKKRGAKDYKKHENDNVKNKLLLRDGRELARRQKPPPMEVDIFIDVGNISS
jgi:hypothetical protein